MNSIYGINGRFLTRPITGVDRFAYEVTKGLDALLMPGEAVIVVPEGAKLEQTALFDNISLVRYGKHNGHFWEQLEFARYLRLNSLLGVSLCNTAPMGAPGIVCIHDMAVKANSTNYSHLFCIWYQLLYQSFSRRAKRIITVSDFSKSEIEKYFPEARGKIEVVPNAWQHIQQINADARILNREKLRPGEFYFAMSSLAPNKNLEWLVETARLNANETFAIAGGMNSKVFGEHDIPQADNVKYLGYVSDGEAKALMQACKAFLYPTFYEGFGIPPMEAMACGTSAVVSDTSVMHEIYGDSVAYIDPYRPIELKEIHTPPGASKTVLDRFSWTASSNRLFEILRSI